MQTLAVDGLAWKVAPNVTTVPVQVIKLAQGPQFDEARNAAPYATMPVDAHRPVPAPPVRSRAKQFRAGKSVKANTPLTAPKPSPGSMRDSGPVASADGTADRTVVLEVTLDNRGVVIADKITKMSANPLRDVTYEMLLLGQRFQGIDLAPGSTLQKTISITFDNPQVNPLP